MPSRDAERDSSDGYHIWLVTAEDATLPLDARAEALGVAIDLAADVQDKGALGRADSIAGHLIAETAESKLAALLSYYRANVWRARRDIEVHTKESLWRWEDEETEKEILHLRKAAYHPKFSELEPIRQCQIETNLGNLLSHVGRIVDAVACWDRAIEKIPKFAMALGNRAYGLMFYARALFDRGHQCIMLLDAYDGFEAALDPDAVFDNPHNVRCVQEFSENKGGIAKHVDIAAARSIYEQLVGAEDQTEEEANYRNWCLHHRLFLNPLNDLGRISVANRDVLSTPSFRLGINEPPTLVRFYNIIKQEYVSARYMLYEGTRLSEPHFSDYEVTQQDTLDYPSFCLAVERNKAAFRSAYSLFDKVGQFINHYWNLGLKSEEVSLRNVWTPRDGRNRRLREMFEQHENWPMRGMYWLSRDILDARPGFRRHTDPNAQEVNAVRNRLEHGFLSVHESDALYATVGAGMDDDFPFRQDPNLHAISRRDLAEKTLRLLQLAREALIYLSLAMHQEEVSRDADSNESGPTPNMNTGQIPDDWKR